MKSKLLLSLLAVATLLVVHPSSAQTSPPPDQTPPTSGSFFSSVTGYFATFNTNLDSTFSAARGTVFTSVDSIQGGAVPLANSLGIEYNLWKSISAETVIRNSGVAGTILSDQLGFGLNFVVHDVKLTAYADAGYIFNGLKGDRIYGEIGLRAFKALTEHTFAGLGIGAQLPANRQVISVMAGFTF